MSTNRALQDINDDLLSACLCIGALADHVAQHGLVEQVLINIEHTADGFHRLMVERRAKTQER